jgi:hypothetical protein
MSVRKTASALLLAGVVFALGWWASSILAEGAEHSPILSEREISQRVAEGLDSRSTEAEREKVPSAEQVPAETVERKLTHNDPVPISQLPESLREKVEHLLYLGKLHSKNTGRPIPAGEPHISVHSARELIVRDEEYERQLDVMRKEVSARLDVLDQTPSPYVGTINRNEESPKALRKRLAEQFGPDAYVRYSTVKGGKLRWLYFPPGADSVLDETLETIDEYKTVYGREVRANYLTYFEFRL